MNTSDILGLVGKLSSLAQQPADSEAERTLQDSFSALAQAAESFFPLLFQSSHPPKSEFRRKFAQILQDARLFLRYPFLYGRTGVGLLTGKGAASADFLRQFCTKDPTARFAKQRSLPFVVYNGSYSEIFTVNQAQNVISLSVQEYEKAEQLYKNRIRLQDLLRSFAFATEARYPDANMLVFPYYASPFAEEYRNLASLCSVFFLLYEPQRNYKSLIPLFRQVHVPVFLVAAPQTSDVSKALDLLSDALAGIPVKCVCPEECRALLAQYNHAQRNFLLQDRLQLLCLKFQHYLLQLTRQHEENVTNLARDSVFVGDLNVQSEQIRELRNQETAALQSAQNLVHEMDACSKNLLQAASTCDQALMQLQHTRYPLQADPVKVPLLPAFLPLYRQTVRYALQCEKYSQANLYLHTLTAMSAPYAFIEHLFYDECMGNPLDSDELEQLRSSPSANSLVAHAQVHFFDQIGLSPAERDAISYQIDEKEKTADEWYFSARKKEKQEGSKQASVLYHKAFIAGSLDAGDWLANYYLQIGSGYSQSMKRLADALIPSAAFAYSQGCLENDRYAQGITYLRIAVVLQFLPAVLYYAEMLYQECLQDRLIVPKAKNAILLYQFILEKNIVVDNPKAKLGVLYYRLGNIERAKYFLEQGCSLPEAQYCFGRMYNDGTYVAQDFQVAKHYLESARQSGHTEAKKLLAQIARKEKQSAANKKEKARQYKKRADYSTTKEQVSVDDEGCFITTATCTAMGKSDTCEELTAFRKFRDETLLASSDGRQLVNEYYRIAPVIVARISQESDPPAFYKNLYTHYISPGYEALMQGDCRAAMQLYCQMVTSLAERYDVPIHDSAKTNLLVSSPS